MSGDGQKASDYSPVKVSFTPDPGFDVIFDGLNAQEELGRPFLFHLDVSSGQQKTDVSKLVGATCSITMNQPSDETTPDRYFHGIVTKISASGLSGGAYHYKAELRPWIWILSHTTDCLIFQNQSAFQIVTKVFRDAGFSDFQDNRQSGAGDIQLEYTVQYNETSLAFVTRLMEQYGFYYYFTYSKTAHTLVIADDPNAHSLVSEEIPYEFDKTEYRAVAAHIWSWSTEHNMNSGKWTSKDYNFETPSADTTGKTVQPAQHQFGSFEVYEYPGRYDDASNGQRHADVRQQAVTSRRKIFKGQSNSRELHAGFRFKLTNHPDKDTNQEYLLIRSVTTLGSAEGTARQDADAMDTYRVEVEAIPGDTPFRLEQVTPRPMIRGPQTAVVVCDPGEEITTDKYGRIKVKFHWDRATVDKDTDRTCWIRTSQTWGGGTWGTMVIPRKDQEVIVTFLEGNPDRPLVSGVVYNANNGVPHTLPDNKTRTTLKSNSSPGGNGSNELHFEDKANSEEIYMHAQKDYRREIGHDEISTVTNDRTTTITNGKESLTVSTGDRSVTVSTGNDSLTVSTGNHSITVSSGKSSVTAMQSITLSVGSNSITIDTSGVTINGMKVSVQSDATMSLQAGATMSLTGAMISLN